MYVQGAEAWAADILRQDLVDSPDSDHLGELWATELGAPGFLPDDTTAVADLLAELEMTMLGGYCDPNGDGSYADGDWSRGWSDYRARCAP